jgi:hypothetical protein
MVYLNAKVHLEGVLLVQDDVTQFVGYGEALAAPIGRTVDADYLPLAVSVHESRLIAIKMLAHNLGAFQCCKLLYWYRNAQDSVPS